jgi:hypothetical protein
LASAFSVEGIVGKGRDRKMAAGASPKFVMFVAIVAWFGASPAESRIGKRLNVSFRRASEW